MAVRVVTRRPPPWVRYSAAAAVEAEVAVGAGSSAAPGFGAPAGIVFPGSSVFSHDGVEAQTTHLVINQAVSGTTVPQLDAGWTVLYRQKPASMQQGYWLGPFHSKYGTDWGGDVSLLHYAGVGYPYPREPGGPAVANAFEISMGGGDQYVWEGGGPTDYSDVPAYGVTYKTVAFIRVVSGWLEVQTYPMWISTSNRGEYLLSAVELASRSHPTAAERCWKWGDARWNMGNERYNGLLQAPSLYTGEDNTILTGAEVDLAFDDPLDSAVSSRCWHTNPAPESASDISDKSGNGHDPELVIGGSAPALSRAEF